MRFGNSTREWPAVLFLCRPKRSGLLSTKETDVGVAALLTRVEGRSSTEGRANALFHFMDQRVAPPKCLWQMSVALQSEAAFFVAAFFDEERRHFWHQMWDGFFHKIPKFPICRKNNPDSIPNNSSNVSCQNAQLKNPKYSILYTLRETNCTWNCNQLHMKHYSFQ